MFTRLFRFLVPTKNDRELRRMRRIVARINALEEETSALSDADLAARTAQFRARYQDGEALDALLPEAFATVREAARRTLGMRHFDVQLIGGITLHEGKIAEMRTGEGKTLVATLPAYLNALSGDAVHLVTVNDYLARRDADWMGPIYRFLGLEVGVIQPGQGTEEKQAAYAADITYGTNNEFGFDYLRDNMAFRKDARVQRGRHFAIVDEVDSILIDEARTPLIISGPSEDRSDLYRTINTIIPRLKAQVGDEEDESHVPGDFVVDEKNRQVELTETGHEIVEEALVEQGLLAPDDSLYSATNLRLLHHVHAALKAHTLFRRDVDYIVQGRDIVIVDEHTGRTMPGRRWGDGTHQAIEAKEGVPIQVENQTLASTTFQNYFRQYAKLSGMTGTADTEAVEFHQIYGLDVVIIPTNKPMVREDANDLVFLSEVEKYDAIVEDIEDCRERGQPVLVGTASVEASERLHQELQRRGIEHNVLNAKFHEQEAHIIAQAGRPGAVTIATNMAGRGTDIVLGGNWEFELTGDEPEPDRARLLAEWQARHDQVIEAGGLHIIGTERHESRRIDNQLRGRAGRQGDPGSSRFYLSLDDNLMRLFASDRIRGIMKGLGMQKGEAIEHRMVNRAIERAQRQVEGHNFDIRKNLLEFDDVANDQRMVIYGQRDELLEAEDISERVAELRDEVVAQVFESYVPPESLEEQWDVAGLTQALQADFALDMDVEGWLREHPDEPADALRDDILERLTRAYEDKVSVLGPDARLLEKQILLQLIDQHWKEHLHAMDQLRYSIHLRAYAQKQPKQEYKRESFQLFQNMLEAVKHEFVRVLSRVQVRSPEEVEEERRLREEAEARARQLSGADEALAGGGLAAAGLNGGLPPGPPGANGGAPAPGAAPAAPGARPPAQEPSVAEQPFVRGERKVGRNEPCPCGSGRKYKHCHGKL